MIAYRLTCIPTGKIYIGITRLTAERRFEAHWRAARNGGGYRLAEALRRYQPSMWTIETLARGSSWVELCDIEKRLIALYGATDPDVGYNVTEGGGGILGYRKTPAQIERSAKHHRGKIVGVETRQRLRIAMLRRWGAREPFPRTSDLARDCEIARHYFGATSMASTGAAFGIKAPAVSHVLRRVEARISECMGGMMAPLLSPPKIHPSWIDTVEG